jgi:hypothetical protein
VPSRFALTFNPLNLIIGRYGFNFEYQPVPHHGLIFSPHYDHLSGDPSWDGEATLATDTLNGVGAELGYRYYSSSHGFDGFFAGPSLLIATYERTLMGLPTTKTSGQVNSVGLAFDVGGQLQLGHFVFGGGVGVQYTTNDRQFGLSGRGVDLLMEWNIGGGVLPRFAINLGYAF